MKKLTTLIIFSNLFWFGELNAQFSISWENDYRHTNTPGYSNEGRKVAVDTLNDLIYTLYDVRSDKDPNGNVTGLTYDYTVLSKYDAAGNPLQNVLINVGNHTVTGFDLKSGFGLQVDVSGNIYVGYMNFDLTTNYDVNIAKFNNQLSQLWNYKFNAPSDDQGIAMEVSNLGNAFAILKSTISGNVRHRIILANAAGVSALPLFTYSAQPDYLSDLTVDASQKVYTTGYRLVNGVKSILMSCVNSAGTLLWSRVDNCGTVTGDDFSRDITLGNDGYLYITGSSQGTVQHGIDAVIMKFNPANGKKVWESFINLNLNDGGYFVINPDPNYVFASWVAGSTIFIDQISAISGTQIRRVNYTPTPVTSFSSLGMATITDMKISVRQNIYITGSIAGISAGQNFSASYMARATFSNRGIPHVDNVIPVTGNPGASFRGAGIALDQSDNEVYLLQDEFDSYTTHAQETVWLVSIDVAGSLRSQNPGNNIDNTVLTVETLPNPVSSELNVSSNSPINFLQILDINGKLLISEKAIDIYSAKVDVSSLSTGVYFVKIHDFNGRTFVSKILK